MANITERRIKLKSLTDEGYNRFIVDETTGQRVAVYHYFSHRIFIYDGDLGMALQNLASKSHPTHYYKGDDLEVLKHGGVPRYTVREVSATDYDHIHDAFISAYTYGNPDYSGIVNKRYLHRALFADEALNVYDIAPDTPLITTGNTFSYVYRIERLSTGRLILVTVPDENEKWVTLFTVHVDRQPTRLYVPSWYANPDEPTPAYIQKFFSDSKIGFHSFIDYLRMFDPQVVDNKFGGRYVETKAQHNMAGLLNGFFNQRDISTATGSQVPYGEGHTLYVETALENLDGN